MPIRITSFICALACMTLVASTHAKLKTQDAKPCILLPESLVRESKSIPAETAVEQDDSSDSRHPNCGYRWRVMSEADEQVLRDRNNEKMMENIKAGKSPSEGISHSIPTHGSIRLTVVQFESDEKAQSALESAKSYLLERARKKGKEPPSWDVVDGVGDKAYYHGKQLSFTTKRELMHLNASPLETAKALANRIIE
jgi:hypothetical protein